MLKTQQLTTLTPTNLQLYEPYADAPHTSGFMRIEPAVLYDVIPKFLENGWQVVSRRAWSERDGLFLIVPSERPCNRRQGQWSNIGCLRICPARNQRHCPQASPGTRPDDHRRGRHSFGQAWRWVVTSLGFASDPDRLQ
jgi:hypothetical protein